MTDMTALCVTVCRDPSKKSKVVAVQAPMQTNAYDCGVYVLGEYSFSGHVPRHDQSVKQCQTCTSTLHTPGHGSLSASNAAIYTRKQALS